MHPYVIALAAVLFPPVVLAAGLLWTRRLERQPAHRRRGFTAAPVLAVIPAFLVALVPVLAPYVLPVLGMVGCALLGLVVREVLAHMKASKARHYLLAILDAGKVGATYVEQKVAPSLRGPDGKLPPNAASAVKEQAISVGLDWLRGHGLETVKDALQLSDEELAQRLGVAVESAVAQMAPSAPALTEKVVEKLPQGGAGGPNVLVKPAPAP